MSVVTEQVKIAEAQEKIKGPERLIPFVKRRVGYYQRENRDNQ
jgi:hypothetical protein